jgi:hypothetical protein
MQRYPQSRRKRELGPPTARKPSSTLDHGNDDCEANDDRINQGNDVRQGETRY